MFVDATYKSVPANFYQLIIVMVFDEISDLYISCCYALITGKSSKVYNCVLYHTSSGIDFALNSDHVSCDFEQVIMNAIKDQFPKAKNYWLPLPLQGRNSAKRNFTFWDSRCEANHSRGVSRPENSILDREVGQVLEEFHSY
ncbi:hypothetical protein L914_03309, partial [Phytophthora nicotianae]